MTKDVYKQTVMGLQTGINRMLSGEVDAIELSFLAASRLQAYIARLEEDLVKEKANCAAAWKSYDEKVAFIDAANKDKE